MRQTPTTLTPLLLLAGLVAGCGGSSSGGRAAASTTAAPVTSAAPAPATSGGPTSTLPTGVVEVLSYNVAGLPQGISSSDPVRNIPQISPLLNAYDLVLVQEDFWYHVELARDARHPFHSPPLVGHSTPMNDGLNTFSQSPFHSLTRVKWSRWHGLLNHSNDGLAAKGFTFARHTFGPGVEVDVYNLHADAGRDQGDIDARRDQFAQLATFIEAFSVDRPLIVAGDTNLKATTPQDEVILVDFMARVGLADAARTIGNLPESIDRVMLRSTADVALAPLRWRFADEFVDAAGGPLSDHLAVHVAVEWRRLR
ncbi:MAG: hypothetical protein M9894_38825 [Planctomycetes bacterium]|nr:hypothetical protein [Planctomycetota bacterium]